jgi:foldase protein PrsA
LNDKIKGLILGAVLGSALTGTAAYASGVQIEVMFRPLTYLFDGVEKKPAEGSGFIYEGSTYVPVRFVSEALGKEVGWDDATGTISIHEPGFNKTIAAYKDNNQEWSVTQGMVTKRAAVARLLNPSYDQYADDPSFFSHMQLEVASTLLATARVDDSVKKTAADEAPAKLEDLKKKFETAFQGQPTWESRLSQLKLSEADILDYWKSYSIRNSYLSQSITEDLLHSEYETAKAAHEFDKATVRHVLVAFTDADGKERSKEDALARTKEAQAKLKAGESFDSVALAYSDDPGSSSNGGQYKDAQIMSWVTGFRDAVLKQTVGQIGEPVETEYGYHVILVESLTTDGFDTVSSSLKERLLDSAYQKLLNDELPKLEQSIE